VQHPISLKDSQCCIRILYLSQPGVDWPYVGCGVICSVRLFVWEHAKISALSWFVHRDLLPVKEGAMADAGTGMCINLHTGGYASKKLSI